ncbi:outer membrane beta-barrel protein [Granulicella sp. S190]|uniref:outer membrane beta-barrel protein n=1 Tax=Granulicella sp. S190 TaxID=1747226 RepID=UPI00131B2210|nr:outer membrane beta-barrel protein [Granulicella sp. S190]
MKRHILIICCACVLSLATYSHAQAVPTASRSGSIQLGIAGSTISPDYTQPYLKGVTFYGDLDVRQHLGVEGEIHYSVITKDDISENSYLLGPRYKWHHGRFEPYAKVLLGVGRFGFQSGQYPIPATFSYFQFAPGGGLDVRVTRHINVRPFDIEFQKWPGFEPHGLSPIAYTFGVAYTLR